MHNASVDYTYLSQRFHVNMSAVTEVQYLFFATISISRLHSLNVWLLAGSETSFKHNYDHLVNVNMENMYKNCNTSGKDRYHIVDRHIWFFACWMHCHGLQVGLVVCSWNQTVQNNDVEGDKLPSPTFPQDSPQLRRKSAMKLH